MNRNALSKPSFLTRVEKFSRKREITFSSNQEASSFLLKYLICECLSGIHFSDTDLEETEKKISSLMEQFPISAKNLPYLNGNNPQKVLYNIVENTCFIRDAR